MADNENHIDMIIRRLGGQNATAKGIGCAQSSVSEWVAKRVVPSRRIPELVAFGKTLTPKVRLSPNDFFPKETNKSNAA